MGQYSRKLKKGARWFYSGQYMGKKYHSKAIYLTRAKCAQAERERLIDFDNESKIFRADMTFLEVCTKRLDFLETKSKYYFGDNKRLFKRLVGVWGANTDIKKISRPLILDYLLSEVRRCKRDGFDNHTVNAQIRHIKAFFVYAMDELECIENNPSRKLKFYPVKKNLKYIPPDDHINMVCEFLLPHQLRIYTFCIVSACRVSEALRATGEDVDEEAGLLTLWTRKKRFSDLTPRRIELPKEIIPLKQEGRLFPEWTQYPRFIEKACKVINIKLFGWHSFRHRKASLMAKNGVPINEIQHHLGHESILVTQQYLHLLGYRL